MLITGVRTLTSALAAPQLSSSVTGNTANLSWTAPTPTGQSVIAGYRVYKSSTLGGTYTQVGSALSPNQLSFTDTLSATSFYKVEAFDQFVTGNRSAGTQCNFTSGGKFVWDPHISLRIGGYSGLISLASLQSAMDAIDPLNIHGRIGGVTISPTMAQLEGATLGDYASKWDAIGAIITMLKTRYLPRTYHLTIAINGGGNGYSTSSTQNPAFLSGFCPAYMNTGNKGSPTSGYGGGEVHQASDGTPLDRPYLVVWNPNVCARIVALIQAYMNHFGPDTSTGGIYRWDMYQEISVSTSAPGFSQGALLATWPAWMSGARAAAPNTLIMMKPTFVPGSNGSGYDTIVNAMFQNHISMGTEDCTPARVDWGQHAYFGDWTTTPIDHRIANGGNPDWDLHQNVDGAEFFWDRDSTKWNTPGATLGTGRIYDQTAQGFQGIWTQVNVSKASHVDVYVDNSGGPNISRRVFSSAAPANYTPGPGAGLIASHPNLIDVLAANTSYAGVLDQGCALPWTQYPSSYPQ